jgi:hypothetical protein
LFKHAHCLIKACELHILILHRHESHYAMNVDNQDDDGYDSDADLEPICGPDDEDYMDLDNHEHVRKVDDKYIFDLDAQMEYDDDEMVECKW